MNGVLCITKRFELGQSRIICFSKCIKIKLVFKIPPKDKWEERKKRETLGDLFSRREKESNYHLANVGLMFKYFLTLHSVLLSQ